eukprot:317288-Alexandrium_andersonii.AAC.1
MAFRLKAPTSSRPICERRSAPECRSERQRQRAKRGSSSARHKSFRLPDFLRFRAVEEALICRE